MERQLQAQATSTPYLPQAKGASQPPTHEGRQQPGQTEQQAGRESIMTDMLKDLFQDQIKTAMEHALLPLSTAIEQEVATIQAEADSITQRGQEEDAQVNEELAKLAQLVHVFQSHILQLLPSDGIMDQQMQEAAHAMHSSDKQ